MDCLIYNNMKSCNKQWNTLPQLWNLLISIFHSSMEFHGTRQMDYHQISSNSMEFHGTLEPPNEMWLSSMEFHFKWARFQKGTISNHTSFPWNSMEYSMEFHGALVPPNEISLSSMDFHGTLRLSFYSIPCYPGLPWDIPWNSTELWNRQIKNHRVLWDSIELGGRHFKWRTFSTEFHGIFHGIPWNSGTAKWKLT